MVDKTWTPERLAALEQGVSDGLTFTQIGEQLGLTKNQCLCKAARLHFQPSDTAVLSKAQINMRNRAPEPSTLLSRLDAIDIFPRRGCVFPVGHPHTEGFHFCGEAVPIPGDPYCPEHRAACWTRAETRAEALARMERAANSIGKAATDRLLPVEG